MGLKYTIVTSFKTGADGEKQPFCFPKLTGSVPLSTNDLAERLSKQTTASPADVHLVITGLADLIPELLMEGFTVKLDNFGSFRLHAKTKVSGSPEKVTAQNIKELRMSFKPDKRVRKKLQKDGVKFERRSGG